MGWVDPWVGLGWVGFGQDFSVFGGLGWVHCSKSTKKIERIVLMLSKHGWIKFGCIKQLNLILRLG